MAAKFTQEPLRLDGDDIFTTDTGHLVATVYSMDGETRNIEGPETDSNRRLFLHSQALYRLASQVADGNGSTACIVKEAKRLVDAIDGVKPKLEWTRPASGGWRSPVRGGDFTWIIHVDDDGQFCVGVKPFPSLAEAKAYCQAEEDAQP